MTEKKAKPEKLNPSKTKWKPDPSQIVMIKNSLSNDHGEKRKEKDPGS